MIKVEVYQPGDVYRFITRECFKDQGDSRNYVEMIYGQGGFVRSFTDEKSVLGVYGARVDCPGVVTLWAYWSEELMKSVRDFAILSKNGVDEVVKVFNPHRLQAIVLSDFAAGIRYCEFLGFKKESEMKSYYGKKDHTIMVRFF